MGTHLKEEETGHPFEETGPPHVDVEANLKRDATETVLLQERETSLLPHRGEGDAQARGTRPHLRRLIVKEERQTLTRVLSE